MKCEPVVTTEFHYARAADVRIGKPGNQTVLKPKIHVDVERVPRTLRN